MGVSLIDRFRGCMLGLALGDAMGAPFEGSPPGTRLEVGNLPETLSYTDDTQMAIGVAGSLSECRGLYPDHMANEFVRNFDPMRGYGWGTIKLIGLMRSGIGWSEANRMVFPEGSFGNGAAMRVAPVGLFYHADIDALKDAARGSALITHAHPLAIEGAQLLAVATALVAGGAGVGDVVDGLLTHGPEGVYREKMEAAREFLAGFPLDAELLRVLGNSVLAVESVPLAIYTFLKNRGDFMDTVCLCISLGGDTDTISSMAGALSGAMGGADALPHELLERLEGRKELESLANCLYEAANG